jgi:addiction module HigA family antidote
MGETNIYH